MITICRKRSVDQHFTIQIYFLISLERINLTLRIQIKDYVLSVVSTIIMVRHHILKPSNGVILLYHLILI